MKSSSRSSRLGVGLEAKYFTSGRKYTVKKGKAIPVPGRGGP
jgi:hypothetical protein